VRAGAGEEERVRAPAGIGESLRWARAYLAERGVEGPDLEAQVLLASSLGISRSRLFSRDGDAVEPGLGSEFRGKVIKRGERVPLAHLLGEREFWSLTFSVDGRVLIPRPETELVVEAAAELLRPGCRVADVGTGSGNIIVAVAREVAGEGWWGVDISEDALAVAGRNVRRHGLEGRIRLERSDLFGAFSSGELQFDAILTNPPYIRTRELAALQPEVRLHDPERALDGGEDGLDLIRRILREAPGHLKSGGFLVLEFGDGQWRSVERMACQQRAFRRVEVRRDLAGKERVMVAERH
jgi:release factor glutamine methyltransferase